jgi:hypothetical protein
MPVKFSVKSYPLGGDFYNLGLSTPSIDEVAYLKVQVKKPDHWIITSGEKSIECANDSDIDIRLAGASGTLTCPNLTKTKLRDYVVSVYSRRKGEQVTVLELDEEALEGFTITGP